MSDQNQPMSTETLMNMLNGAPQSPQIPQGYAPPQAPQYPPQAPQYPPQAPQIPQAPQYPPQAPQIPQGYAPPQAPPQGYPPVPGMSQQFPPVNPPGEYNQQAPQGYAPPQAPQLPANEAEPAKRKRRTKAELAQAGGTTSNVTLGGQSYEITILITPVG